jgi:hypothetical protein
MNKCLQNIKNRTSWFYSHAKLRIKAIIIDDLLIKENMNILVVAVKLSVNKQSF